jgi:peroxiredoxin
VDVVGVAWNGSEGEFQTFIDRHGLTFPQISDDDGNVYDRFGIPIQPALVVIDAAGEVQTLSGSVDVELLDRVFEDATT